MSVDLNLPALVSGGTLPSYSILSPCYRLVVQCWGDCPSVKLSTMGYLLYQKTDLIGGQCLTQSILLVSSLCQENFFYNPRGQTQSSNTCHSQKIFLCWSWVSKQPRGSKQYRNSNDFIYSFNTKILPLCSIPGAYEVDQQCHKMFWQMTFSETMTRGLKATLWT